MFVSRVVSGGNSQRLGQRGGGMGTDALVQGAGNITDVHDADILSPSIPQQPLGVCPVVTTSRWMCGNDYCARGDWDSEMVCVRSNHDRVT